jgi:hypothetical protein
MNLVHKGLIMYNNVCSPGYDCAFNVLLSVLMKFTCLLITRN